METSRAELANHRFNLAVEDLQTAIFNLNNKLIRASIIRSYHSILYAIRAVNALDGFDSKKHSRVISYFDENFVKMGVLDKDLTKLITNSLELRKKADCDDFVVFSLEDAIEQIDRAKIILHEIEIYLILD